MSQLSIEQAMLLASGHHRAGRLAQAEQLARQVAAAQPNHAEALHMLGVIAFQLGRLDAGIDLIRGAIAINPNVAHYQNNLANGLSDKGLRDEAVAEYRLALRLRPNDPEIQNNLGVALRDLGKPDDAIAILREAIRAKPDYPEPHNNLAIALRDKGLVDESIAQCRRAITLRPNYADAHCNLGNALRDKGQLDAALAAYRDALRLNPGHAQFHCNLANALLDKGLHDEAIAAYQQSLRLNPNNADAHNNLANALRGKGQLDDAIAGYRRALAHQPDYAEASSNLGIALKEKGQIDDAIAAHRRAIQLKPNLAEAFANLGDSLRARAMLDDAIAAFREAIRLKPQFAEGYHGLSAALAEVGLHDEAIESNRRALALRPKYEAAWSHLLLSMLHQPDQDPATILAEHRRSADTFAGPFKPQEGIHSNDRSPNRRLRIGYVSADFRRHPVGYFLLPLFEHRDRASFAVYCYHNHRTHDEITTRLKRQSDVWRDVADLPDDDVAALIRADAIDILIDLSAHTRGNRLLVFARKPAPVQATYLAYPGTTGLDTIDYRISDPFIDPLATSSYQEQTLRLPHSYWCYKPVMPELEISPSPSIVNGFITFGCLNQFSKVSAPALESWCKILVAGPNSRLLLHTIAPGSHGDRIRQTLAAHGVSADRLICTEWVPLPQYMERYRHIDIALDPFPYAGGTTTCDALWMGVPVITLAGNTPIGRGGVSILSNIGFAELIADSTEQYAEIAVALANDPARLQGYRREIREKMMKSPLMDAGSFTSELENAYRQMWRNWCEPAGQLGPI